MAKKVTEEEDGSATITETEPQIEVEIDSGEHPRMEEAAPKAAPEVKEDVKKDDDIEALRKQLSDLKTAQELSNQQSQAAERRAQAQVEQLRQTAEQSQYDSIVTAMGASQVEVDAAKRDIAAAMAAQDGQFLADAQERLAAAKSRQVSLEAGKDNYEQRRKEPQQDSSGIDSNPNLTYEEKGWLKSHPEVLSDMRKNAKLNAAYYDAMDKGLQRGTRDYFNFIEEQMGYREKPTNEPKRQDTDSPSVMVAAPPSRTVPSASGNTGSRYTISKEEAEVARISGISPAEYVKQKLLMEEAKKKGQIQ